MITAEAIIEILSERGEFANFCNKCEWAEHISADEENPECTTCERCEGEPMDPACVYYHSIRERRQDLANWIEIFEEGNKNAD